jgi:hypothetical protein
VTIAATLNYGLTSALVLLTVLWSIPVAAQSLDPGPPGPFVFDIRGVTSGIPSSETFVTNLPTAVTLPTRGFGASIGGHVYAISLGPARFGLGVDLMLARGTTVDATTTIWSADPQLSVNFGTADGWSYLSAGVGAARVEAEPAGLSESVRSINWGGGARWFLSPHFGVGFDVRVRTLAAGDFVPKGSSLSAGVGFSVK